MMHKYYAPVSALFAGLLVGLAIIYWGHPGSESPAHQHTASRAAASVDHSAEMPPVPVVAGQAPYVNMQRMNQLAAQKNYKGPSFKETYADAEKMVAQKAEDSKSEHRLPANSNPGN